MSGLSIRQRRVLELHPRLKDISSRNLRWAKERLFEREVYTWRGECWCTECGASWAGEPQIVNVKYQCPKCGVSATLKKSKRQKYDGVRYYFTVLDVCKEWQVARHYVIERAFMKGAPARYECYEAVQVWIDADGKEVIMARPRRCFSHYYDLWIPTAPMGVRRKGVYGNRAFYINAPVASVMKLLPIVKRNGYTRRCTQLPADEQIKAILRNSKMETLIKNGQYALLEHFYDKCDATVDRYWPSIKIAIRNGYKIKDATLWRDTIDNLNALGRDVRNSSNVCPTRLTELHDRLCDIIARRNAREKHRKLAMEARESTEAYRQRLGAILDIKLSIGNLMSRPLQDVGEFYEEGEAMSHCVYQNKYYAIEDSVIFTVRDDCNKRLATVEYSLSRGEVLQCRGRHNSKPQRYNDIIRMFDTCKLKIERFTNRP